MRVSLIIVLPRKYRLTSDYDFRRVRRLGRVYHTPYFSINIAKAKNPGDLRFGFIVSKKIDKRAVVRNRIARLLREMVANKLSGFPIGFDVVFVTKGPAIGVDLNTLSTKFSSLIPQIGK